MCSCRFCEQADETFQIDRPNTTMIVSLVLHSRTVILTLSHSACFLIVVFLSKFRKNVEQSNFKAPWIVINGTIV